MYDRIRVLYLSGSLNDTGLQNAVAKGWITQAEFDRIVAEKLAQT